MERGGEEGGKGAREGESEWGYAEVGEKERGEGELESVFQLTVVSLQSRS